MFHNKSTWGFVAFFALMALMVPRAESLGYGMSGIFFAIVVAAGVAVLVPLIFKLGRQHLAESGMSMRDLGGFMVGAPQVVDSDPNARAMVLYDQGEIEQYEGDDEPEEDELYSLIEPGGLPLADNFVPSPESLACQNVTIVGVRRSGKSNALTILLHRLAAFGFPLVVFDTECEYEELARKRYMPRGVLVGSEDVRSDAPDGLRFTAIDQATAYNFGQFVLEQNLQVVVNLKAWTSDQAALIMSEMILGMEDWQQQRPIARRIPFYVAIDEITTWVPQNLGESTLSKESIRLVQHALFDVAVRRGGKRGFGLLVAGQKYAEIDKRILQGPWKIIFQQTENNDLRRCGEAPLNLDPNEVSSLQRGESFVYCPQLPGGMYVQWPVSSVPLGGKSPGIANLREHHRTLNRNVTGVLARLQMTPSATAFAEEPEEVHTEPLPVPSLRYDLKRASELWSNGANSIRKLQTAMGIATYYQASEVVRLLKEKRLIA